MLECGGTLRFRDIFSRGTLRERRGTRGFRGSQVQNHCHTGTASSQLANDRFLDYAQKLTSANVFRDFGSVKENRRLAQRSSGA